MIYTKGDSPQLSLGVIAAPGEESDHYLTTERRQMMSIDGHAEPKRGRSRQQGGTREML